MARDFPESAEAAAWRELLAGVSIAFGSIATIAFLLRVIASRVVVSAKGRVDDVLMGCAVLLMWGDVTAVLLSPLSSFLFFLFFFTVLTEPPCMLAERG